MYRIAISTAAAVISAAASAYEPAHIYNQVRVINNSSAIVSDVTVIHQPSGRSYRCDAIKPLQVCAHYFGKRRFDPGPFEVTWRFDGGAMRTRSFDLGVPPFFHAGNAIQGIVDIDISGQAGFRHEQYTPL